MSRQFELPGGYYVTVVAGADEKAMKTGVVVGSENGRARGERNAGDGHMVVTQYGVREWAMVDIAMLIVFVSLLCLLGCNDGEQGMALYLLLCRMLLSAAVLNRARPEFFVAGVTAAWTAKGLYAKNSEDMGFLLLISSTWILSRVIMFALRTLIVDAVYLNKLLAFLQSLAITVGAIGVICEGYCADAVMSSVLGAVTVLYLYRLRHRVYAYESAVLYVSVCFIFPSAMRQVVTAFVLVEMFSLREFTAVAVGERFRQVVDPGIPVAREMCRLSEGAGRVAIDFWKKAEARVERLSKLDWAAMGREEKGAKAAEVVRKYALIGDKMLALSLEMYAFGRRMVPSEISSYRQTLLTNKAFSRFFDNAYREVFPELYTRSEIRKGTCVEAIVGVSADSLADWTEGRKILNLVAESLESKSMMSDEPFQRKECVGLLEDSTFKLQDLQLVSRLAGAAEFDRELSTKLFGGDYKCDRQLLKQLSRVGRAALEAQLMLNDVDLHNITVKDMTLFLANYLTEDVVARVYVENVCAGDERRGIKLGARTLAENMFALVGICMIYGEYERIVKLSVWYEGLMRKTEQEVWFSLNQV